MTHPSAQAPGGGPVETIVVGAGPAGLAVGACLRNTGLPFLMLEKADRVGVSWHRHYDRLRLHTHKGTSRLPFLPLPRRYPTYPSRAQFIEYLEAYADHFRLEPRFDQEVRSARFHDDRWEVRTQDAVYHALNLVIATGYANRPVVPDFPGLEDYRGRVLHTSAYRNGEPFRGQNVLVVGCGNSGGEIAIDLFEHGARVSLCVRGPVNIIRRDLVGIPVLALAVPLGKLPARLVDALIAPLGKLLYGDQEQLGLAKLPYGPMVQITRTARIPLVDIGTIRLIRAGHIRVKPAIDHFTPGGVVFRDGSHEAYDAVVMGTGYRSDAGAFLEEALRSRVVDERGNPRAVSFVEAPGLYFCGFQVAVSGMLREIGREARVITRSIRQRHQQAVAGAHP